MRIRRIEVNNFKSLVDFKIDLAKFTCLIGLNGSGKSTVLQFLDFLARQVQGGIKGWLRERNWDSSDFRSKLTSKKVIDFKVELTTDSGEEVHWSGTFNPAQLRCTAENISISQHNLIVKDGAYSIGDTPQPQSPEPIPFSYEGSILSQLRGDKIPEPFVRFKEFFENLKSLDLLSPDKLRNRTSDAKGSLGLGGRNLSAFLNELGSEGKLNSLRKKLSEVYKYLHSITTSTKKGPEGKPGSIHLAIEESFNGTKLSTEARHINDGLLRLLAIFGELQTEHRFLLFDEIENGINPELVEFVVDSLVSAPQQVLVTTHSPMILNYLEDDIARNGVVYLYKTREGHTKAIPFFSIPSLSKKLEVMGPGEAFVDTNLSELQEEIEASTGVVG